MICFFIAEFGNVWSVKPSNLIGLGYLGFFILTFLSFHSSHEIPFISILDFLEPRKEGISLSFFSILELLFMNIFQASVDGVDSLVVNTLVSFLYSICYIIKVLFVHLHINIVSLLHKSEQDADNIPTPIVLIDQGSDPSATIVHVSFGDRLGALIDTVNDKYTYFFDHNTLVVLNKQQNFCKL